MLSFHTTKQLQEAVAMAVEKQKLWDERTGRCLAEFVNNVRAESLIVELSAEEGRRLTTSEILLLLKVSCRDVSEGGGGANLCALRFS